MPNYIQLSESGDNDEKNNIQAFKDAVLEFFKKKHFLSNDYVFEKKCEHSNIPEFKNACAQNIALRLTSLKDTIKHLLSSGLYTNINNATDLHKGLTRGSIQEALDYCKHYKKPHGLNQELTKFLEAFFPVKNYHKKEAEYEDSVDEFENRRESVITGGRRSRYRRRPTKKYFKSRRHSSPKKKRHMKTKRHMKRHTKRHRKTNRH